ncbi:MULTISPECIES: M1 family metallopeptidase [Myxococcus]|uniref:Aminopeptidase N n=1 Tax=Myxococcus llanfairpwllgwyngyllgogerychwyrndrobwllllantysiliogogogochensis TaxID=2590453 RepID=A0A540X185_9BACT|nr:MULTISPECIES: M1 family metallopeptidase [Myxococcus]NTX01152.1 M1 family metallopeptidase [Myxococcus sp. CA040A]TQF14424.1 M1 family metallopeptidase [Myxococcus llanfairpwllgwyngyllgogerychwyrndrobwllllantysiliogogogochensis]
MARPDPHSYNDSTQPETETLDWKARVDFRTRRLHAEATLTLKEASAGPLDLDTRDLEILRVVDGNGRPLPYMLAPPEPILGSRLRVELPSGVRQLTVHYRTSPTASALQWLTPSQTAGGQHPFLYSQCQAIHARSVVPLQDTPRIRIRYRASLRVPKALKAVMAASFVRREEHGVEAEEHYEMPQPVPPYLLAFAVGSLAPKELGPRSRVWAEPELLEDAAEEFSGVDDMLRAAESLFGPYDWERFDLLTMPPSFPYGGMENPRLTFLTPTLIAGDKSLVNVVAHELAHSWTGNLVTNASAEHFWLNEGFTVFAERRILEALAGPEVAALNAALGRRALDEALHHFREHPHLTALRTHLTGVDPDEAFSQIPYEKGYLFLRAMEDAVGREAFDGFLRRYLATYRFRALTTEEFIAFTERELPGVLAKVDAEAYLQRPGVPASAPSPRSSRLEALQRARGTVPSVEAAKDWTPAEWQLFLEWMPSDAPKDLFRQLDERFAFTRSRNSEVLVAWLVAALRAGWEPAVGRTEAFLGEVGRMKYLKPLYGVLAASREHRALARSLFKQYGERYHPIARQGVELILSRA